MLFRHEPDRKSERPAQHLRDFRGILQVDGYAGFESLTISGRITLAACWTHARRKFYELHKTGLPVATEALRRIGQLYEIERKIRGQPPDERQRVRQKQSQPIVEEMHDWLQEQLGWLARPSAAGRSDPLCARALAGVSFAGSGVSSARPSSTPALFRRNLRAERVDCRDDANSEPRCP